MTDGVRSVVPEQGHPGQGHLGTTSLRPPMNRHPVAAIIPLKAVADSKTRMAATLSASDRALLLSRTFGRVAVAVQGTTGITSVLVVAGDDRGARWAADHGFDVLREPASCTGLNEAIRLADAHIGSVGTVVLPADLPLVAASDLERLLAVHVDGDSVVVAPTADGGTGALLRRPGAVIGPCFGPNSASRHLSAAATAGVASVSVWIPGLALDLDRPSDLARAGGWSAVTGDVASP